VRPPPPDTPLARGDIVVFPMGKSEDHVAPFGVGRLLEVRGPNNLKIQWWGNRDKCKPSGTFRPGWVTKPSDNRGYFSHKKDSPQNPEWTTDHSRVTIAKNDIIIKGSPKELFASTDHFRAKYRSIISDSLEEEVNWNE
jgi:hypothetical protein